MVTMKWVKDAAGRLVPQWNDSGKEPAPKKLVWRYRKAPQTETDTVPVPKPTVTVVR